ncbi:TPA: glycosyl hydrolase family 31, partial [Streptococcus pneumoniae]
MKIFKGEFYRISVLTDKLVRLEYSRTGNFEDRTTQLIYNRDFGQISLDY